ncbi:hypothetical protein ACOBQX_24470 [Actinokineospora sp. G85]|uniref:hypothetical protein n=1 Tax=Actinokineospora sp. G85 TaxID=3406626 RepID=UPI003C78D6F6
MSWQDHYRRQAAMEAVLTHARHDPARPLALAEVPLAAQEFTSTDELLLALHHVWTRRLIGHVETAVAEADRDPRVDRVKAVSAAWQATVDAAPVLARLLAAHDSEALRPVREAEQRLLAQAAGLADEHESAAEAARIGAAYLALLRSTPEPAAEPVEDIRPRRSPVSLLRRLVASA